MVYAAQISDWGNLFQHNLSGQWSLRLVNRVSITSDVLHNFQVYVEGLVQDCSNSIANALELLQSCTEPSMYFFQFSVALGYHIASCHCHHWFR